MLNFFNKFWGNAQQEKQIKIEPRTKVVKNNKLKITSKELAIQVKKVVYEGATIVERQKAYFLPSNHQQISISSNSNNIVPDLNVIEQEYNIEPITEQEHKHLNSLVPQETEHLHAIMEQTNSLINNPPQSPIMVNEITLAPLTSDAKITYNLDIQDELRNPETTDKTETSKDVIAKLIVSKFYTEPVDSVDSVTITKSCTYDGNRISLSSRPKNFERIIDFLPPKNIHLDIYDERVKGISVDVVKEEFQDCSPETINAILKLLVERDQAGNQYIGDDIALLRCVIDDNNFITTSRLVVLKKPTIYKYDEHLKVQLICYLFIAPRDIASFNQNLPVIIKKLRKLKTTANIFSKNNSVDAIWKEMALIDWSFEIEKQQAQVVANSTTQVQTDVVTLATKKI